MSISDTSVVHNTGHGPMAPGSLLGNMYVAISVQVMHKLWCVTNGFHS